MSSGSYFPPPVRTVMIDKSGGGQRRLGIPTVGDRVAQMVVKMVLEPQVEPHFHPDSYGYRPGKSAHQAVEQARRRCWSHAWVLDLDVRGFLDLPSYYTSVNEDWVKRVGFASNACIRKPLRLPQRICTASSCPSFTRCNTVCRETPRIRVASIIGTKPTGAVSTKRDRSSSFTRIRQGAPGVSCSPAMKSSASQR